MEAAGASETPVNLNGTTELKITKYGKTFFTLYRALVK
jgi:hypothetical protein